MANRLNPTAANIISSLGVKGATVNEPLEGYVPVLGPDGKLSVEFIPDSAAKMSVPPISNVAFVDKGTSETDPLLRNGSIAAPFNSIAEAASNFNYSGIVAIVIAPGVYDDSVVTFKPEAKKIYLIGLGLFNVYLNGGSFNVNVGSNAELTIQNLNVSTTMSVSPGTAISLVGNTHVNTLSSENSSLTISSESRVESTNVTSVSLASDSRHIANTSSVEGDTVGDALDRLDARKIRILRMTAGSSGVDAGSSYTDIGAESYGGEDIYDLRSRDSAIVSALSELFRRSRHVNAEDVTADTVYADVVTTRTLSIDALRLGGYRVEVDTYGYLVVGDGSNSPVRPPSGSVLLRDEITGSLWALYVESGRLYVERFYEDSSSSGSPAEEYDFIELVDALDTYRVKMSNGRLVIDEGSSS